MATGIDRAPDRDMAVTIDARGLRCPWPALRAARALREGAGALRILADDPAAAGELAALAAEHGRRYSTISAHVHDISATVL